MIYMNLALYMSKEPDYQMLREVHSLPLEDQLQANRRGCRFWPLGIVI